MKDDLKSCQLGELLDRLMAAASANVDHVRRIKSLEAELKAAQESLAKIEQPAMFEIGKCYRKKRGGVSGPLRWNTEERRRATDMAYVYWDGEQSFTVLGWLYLEPSEYDLLPGAVEPPPSPTWTPPCWLRDGEYMVDSDLDLRLTLKDSWSFSVDVRPSKAGRWRVEQPNATYLGPT